MNTDSWQKMRAIRRQHRNRIIRKRYQRVQMGYWYVKSSGYLAKNNTVCSCWMCGNPRKHFGELTRQEKIAESSLDYPRGKLISIHHFHPGSDEGQKNHINPARPVEFEDYFTVLNPA